MTVILIIFLVAFGVVAGAFLGAGNYNGLAGAIFPGLVAGLLASFPLMRDSLWYSCALLVVCAIVGSIGMSIVSDQNGLKRFCRKQSSLVVSIGSYKLGQKSGD